MNPEELISECRRSGVSVRVEGEKIKLRGDPEIVKMAADRLRPYKAEVMQHLNQADVWGPHTPYCCPVPPALVEELKALIAQYARAYTLSAEATARIIDAAKRQPAALVPSSVDFFKRAVAVKPVPGEAMLRSSDSTGTRAFNR